MRVAIYARYSDDSQKATSLDDQVSMCKQTAERLGFVVSPALIFKDGAISGQGKKTIKRTQYQALREAIRAGEIDVLICDQQCRLARNAKESLTFLEELGNNAVRLLTADGFDSIHPTAQLIFGIKSVFSEFFIDETRHRVLRSMNGEFDRGSMVTAIPYGYKLDLVRSKANDKCHWLVDKEEAEIVREIFRNRKDGMSLNQIAAILNGRGVSTPGQVPDEKKLYWRASALCVLLRNPTYKGLYQVNFGRNKGDERRLAQRLMPEIALVSEYDWKVVSEMGKRSPSVVEGQLIESSEKNKKGAYGGGKHALAGLFRCGICGVHLSCHHARTDVGSMHCIQCEHATNVGILGRQPLHLSIKGLRVMLRWLLEKVISPDVVNRYQERLKARLVGGRDAELAAARQDLAKAERSRLRLARMLGQIEGEDTVLEDQYNKTRADVLELTHHVHALDQNVRELNVVAIQQQLDIDLSQVVDAFLSDQQAPERTRALLNRIFPALTLRGKLTRFIAIFEVHVKPGAILAQATDTPLLVDGLEVMWVKLTTSGSKNPSWSVEQIEAPNLGEGGDTPA